MRGYLFIKRTSSTFKPNEEVLFSKVDEEICEYMNVQAHPWEFSIYFNIVVSCGIFCTENVSKDGDFDLTRYERFMNERYPRGNNERLGIKIEQMIKHFLLEKYYFVSWRQN